MTNQSNTQSTLSPTRVATNSPTPDHSEVGSWCLQIGSKTQGMVAVNPTAAMPTVVGRKYYVKQVVRLRGSTAGVVSMCAMIHGNTTAGAAVNLPNKGVAYVPVAEGLQTTDITG